MATPTFNPGEGHIFFTTGSKTITITTATTSCNMRYTLDGTTPTASYGTLIASSNGTMSLVPSPEGRTLKAIAYKAGMSDSAVSSATYYYENGNAPEPEGGTADASRTYDANGNLTTYNGSIYTYDAQNRLMTASGNGHSATFYYDGRNRQIARVIDNQVRFSVWDDWELIEEYASSSSRSAAYLQGAHGVIRALVGASYYYYYQDSLGSTTHIANAAGQLLESFRYDLYGTPAAASAYGLTDLYAGERWIPELGLYDLRNRFMSPELGRFLQADPIGFKGDGSNLYRYCHNDPADFSDPSGLVDVRWSGVMYWQGNAKDSFDTILQAHLNFPAGNQNVMVMGQHVGSNSQEQKTSGPKSKSDAPLRFIVRRDKTENNRYNSTFYYQLATSGGKRLRGFDYVVTQHTTIIHSDFGVKKSDDKYGPLTRDGLFVDGVGFTKRPGDHVMGSDIRLQRFELQTYDGQKGPPVSTVLRHETRMIDRQMSNNVFEVTP